MKRHLYPLTLPKAAVLFTVVFVVTLFVASAAWGDQPSCDSGVVVPMTVAPPVVVGTVGGGR